MADQEPTQDLESQGEPKPRKALLNKIVIALFVVLVVAGECLCAYLWIPSADEVAAAAKSQVAQDLKKTETDSDESEQESEAKRVIEVDVGTYSVTAHQPTTNTNLRIDFRLFATVAEADQSEFTELYAANQHRFRDHVIFEIRNSNIRDLADPGLGLIKRRILEKSNKLLGKPLIRSVVVSEFSFVDQ
jgi:flagellar FliL protein